MQMLNKQLHIWLLCLAAVFAAGCSGTPSSEELAAYWEGHDFTSLDGFSDIDEAEDKFDGYIDLLSKVPHEEAVANLRSFLDSASQNVVAYMVWSGWFEPYFHAHQSPYRNDAMFVAWLDMVLEDKVIDDGSMMEHLEQMRAVMDHNTVGSIMPEIGLRFEDGTEFMISELYGEKTLFLFVDANCPSCMSSLEENAREYKGTDLVAVLVGGSRLHIDNIREQMPESVLEKWTLVCGSQRTLEEASYDTSNLPTRLLVAPNSEIIKSYH